VSSVNYVNLPGLRIHVAEAGTGEAVVLPLGFSQHWWEWRKVIPRLTTHYGLICPEVEHRWSCSHGPDQPR